MRLRTHLYRILFFLLLSYGFLYFSYKWLNPLEMTPDFVMYYGMIQHPLDFHAAQAPWVYRQLTVILAHALWRMHVFYPTQIKFNNPLYDQHIFFATLFTNYLAVVAAAWISTLLIDRFINYSSELLPLIAGMLCFFGFYMQGSAVGGLTDALNWTFVALCYLLYQRRSKVPLCAVLMASILQREVLPIIFLAFACTELLRGKRGQEDRGFFAVVAISSVIAMGGYLLLRHVIHAPGNEYQADPHAQLHALLAFRPRLTYLRDVFFGQNLLILLAILWLAEYRRRGKLNPALLPLFAACFALILVSVIANIGENVVRILAFLTPIAAMEITIALITRERRNHPYTEEATVISPT